MKKFWVPMRNRASELRIPCSDSLPLGHRLHGERDIFCIWSFCIKRSVVKVPNLFPFRILIFTSIQRSPPRSLQRSAARGTGLSPVKAEFFQASFRQLCGTFLCLISAASSVKVSSTNNYDHFISFTFIYHLPSSFVLVTTTGLFGPSPSEV